MHSHPNYTGVEHRKSRSYVRWSLASTKKALKAHIYEYRVWPQRRYLWQRDRLAVKRLYGVGKRWPVMLMEDVLADLHHEVGAEPNKIRVERRMMQLAEGETIDHARLTLRFGVGNNVRSIEKLFMAEMAEGTLALVGFKNTLAENTLM